MNAEVEATKELREFARQAHAESTRKERSVNELLKQEQAKVLRFGAWWLMLRMRQVFMPRGRINVQNKATEERSWGRE